MLSFTLTYMDGYIGLTFQQESLIDNVSQLSDTSLLEMLLSSMDVSITMHLYSCYHVSQLNNT